MFAVSVMDMFVVVGVVCGVVLAEEATTTTPGLAVVPLIRRKFNFYGKVTVGTPVGGGPPQELTVLFDTGSKHLWLASKKSCPNQDCSKVKYKTFDGSQSSSYIAVPSQRFSLTYMDHTTINGSLAWDMIQVGSGDVKFRVNQTFGEADVITSKEADSDGVLGLGLISWDWFPGHPSPPFTSMVDQLHIPAVFSLYLNQCLKGDDGGKLVFGGHDEGLVDGAFTSHAVEKENNEYHGWRIKFDKIRVWMNSPTLTYNFEYSKSNTVALVDSGCTAIKLPEEMYDQVMEAIYKHVPFDYEKKNYAFSCDKLSGDMPNVTLTLGGEELLLRPQDYVWRSNSGKACKAGFSKFQHHVVLGQIFMRNFYTRFDMGDHTVGFARARHPPEGLRGGEANGLNV